MARKAKYKDPVKVSFVMARKERDELHLFANKLGTNLSELARENLYVNLGARKNIFHIKKAVKKAVMGSDYKE